MPSLTGSRKVAWISRAFSCLRLSCCNSNRFETNCASHPGTHAASGSKQRDHILYFFAQKGYVKRRKWLNRGCGRGHRYCMPKTAARSMDCKSLLVEEFPYPSHQENFMMLIIPAVSPPFQRFQLREFLFPVTQYVWFDSTQVTGRLRRSWKTPASSS